MEHHRTKTRSVKLVPELAFTVKTHTNQQGFKKEAAFESQRPALKPGLKI
jgi:hypothetical protein